MDKPGRTWSKYSDYSRIITIRYKTEHKNWFSETLKVFCTATTEVVKKQKYLATCMPYVILISSPTPSRASLTVIFNQSLLCCQYILNRNGTERKYSIRDDIFSKISKMNLADDFIRRPPLVVSLAGSLHESLVPGFGCRLPLLRSSSSSLSINHSHRFK